MQEKNRPGIPTIVLVIDDEATLREVLETRLSAWGYDVLLADDGPEAQRLLETEDPDIVISDLRLPSLDGLDILDLLRDDKGMRPCILITAYGTVDVAVEAMKRGARDVLTKPLDYTRLRKVLDNLERDVEFRRVTRRLDATLTRGDGMGALIGTTPSMREIFELIRTAAPTNTAVMITGESGTGKEVVARTLHAMGSRPGGPFVAVNSAALPEGLVEAELFGHERGAFTGAVAQRPGSFELAHQGTLFLDEIAEMPLALQPKLLRVLEDGRLRPIGARDEVEVDVRVVAATNRVPEEAIAQHMLRADLYYRLSVFHLHLPPLRERRQDIPLLVSSFIEQSNAKHGTSVIDVSPGAMQVLTDYAWPGNIRELRNVIERTVILARRDTLQVEHLPRLGAGAGETSGGTTAPLTLPPAVTAAEAERILILETLKQVGNNKAAAARRLGIDVKTIRNKLKAYGVSASE